jgi:hypothetical protein
MTDRWEARRIAEDAIADSARGEDVELRPETLYLYLSVGEAFQDPAEGHAPRHWECAEYVDFWGVDHRDREWSVRVWNPEPEPEDPS